MKVNELVEMYEKNNRIDIVKHLDIVPYVGIEYKRELAKLVLDNCTSIVDGEVHIDSVERYLLFTISVISMHTNLEFSDNENEMHSVIDDYDALCKSGLLVKIIDAFKDDYASCQEILNMMTADRLQNNMTLEKKLFQFIDLINEKLGKGLDALMENLDLDALGNIGKDELAELYNFIANK